MRINNVPLQCMKDVQVSFARVTNKNIEQKLSVISTPETLSNVCGFFLCLHGWVKINRNGKEYLMRPNDLFIYSPTSYIQVIEYSKDIEVILVKNTLERVLPILVNPANLFVFREKPFATLNEVQMGRIQKIEELIVERQEACSKIPKNDVKTPLLLHQITNLIEAYYHDILFEYLSIQGEDVKLLKGKSKIFQQFILLLVRHYKQEREVTFYAKELYLSARYFSTVVKEVSGHTASEWIIRFVVGSISQTLLHTDKSIKEIAMEYSFPSQSFFGKYFKQYTGMSPRAYRVQQK